MTNLIYYTNTLSDTIIARHSTLSNTYCHWHLLDILDSQDPVNVYVRLILNMKSSHYLFGQVHEKFALQIFSYQCDFCVLIIGIVN